ncbi:hypothetical protein HAX54_025767 [Datura stramonium]|uniref:Uncharacterized protein n=1 Tax=Datura stramonium TaxID=4076 RepID=A0ABS8S6F8_DATST|nr:hypothetical protein [Datura stramonium]
MEKISEEERENQSNEVENNSSNHDQEDCNKKKEMEERKEGIEEDADEEVANNLIETFAPGSEQESVEETQEEEHEDFAETHRMEQMEKEGLSPMKRIRSRHRKKNGRRTREKTAPTHKEGGSNREDTLNNP